MKPSPTPPSKTAVITFNAGILPGVYTLTLKTGIQDSFGNAMVGSGLDGKGHVTVALYALVTDDSLPSSQPGLTFQPGSNAVFPENLPRPPGTGGFNPADRVETRVVRLYYFRDAHRVAQIVNRDVKSYNRTGVDIRVRAARPRSQSRG